MKKLLITAFEPFGGEEINASLLVLERLPEVIGEWNISKLAVPVVFDKAAGEVIAKAEEIKPEAILCLGQAAGRSKVTPEYVGINFRNARIADNAGLQPLREKIVPDGPDAYFSTLPVFDMAEAITKNDLPGEVSYSAGTYVCNDLLYSLLHHYNGTNVRVAFMHLPLSPKQVTNFQPCMEISDMVDAVVSAIEAL